MRRGIVSWSQRSSFPSPRRRRRRPGPGSRRPSSPWVARAPRHTSPTYGLCSGPGNADAFPSRPGGRRRVAVPQHPEIPRDVVPTPTTAAASCGGYTVAFGRAGRLQAKAQVPLAVGKWGDTPLTQANCTSARVADRGLGLSLLQRRRAAHGAWERIGTRELKARASGTRPARPAGLSARANATMTDYATVNIDVIATQGPGSSGGAEARRRVDLQRASQRPMPVGDLLAPRTLLSGPTFTSR